MKIALGTVQFGQNYGVANTSGKLDSAQVGQVLKFAKKSGIKVLDTAISYGESEAVLGRHDLTSWKVVTKLPAVDKDCYDIDAWVLSKVRESLKKLQLNCLHGLILHRPEQLLGCRGKDLYAALRAIKEAGLVHKIGISVYGPIELQPLFDEYAMDLVQAPLSILDRRLVESGWANRLKQAGVEVHSRSAFLQGLLLMPPDSRPEKFQAWAPIWRIWDKYLADMGLSPLQACLRYFNTNETVDHVLVGVDTLLQLQEVVLESNGKLPNLPLFPSLQDERLINPASWGQF